MLKRLLSLALILSVTSCIYAQKTKSKSDEPDNKNIDRYLNDGRIGNVKNLVRLRLNPAISGYFGLSYERKLTRKFGLEGGLYVKGTHGTFMENYRFTQEYGDYSPVDLVAIENGMGFLVYPKLYLTGKAMNYGYHFGIKAQYRSYKATFETPNIPVQKGIIGQATAVMLMVGSHQQFGPRFTWGFEWGAGYHNDLYKNISAKEYDYSTGTEVVTKRNYSAPSILLAADLSFGFLF